MPPTSLINLFKNIEKRFGNFAKLIKPKPIITLQSSDELNATHLAKLFDHQVCAIHVKGFYPKLASEYLSRHFLETKSSNIQNWQVASARGLESSDVNSVGTPFNMVVSQNDPKAIEKYFEEALPTMRKLRMPMDIDNGIDNDIKASSCPHLSPIDKLRLELDEIWPTGASVTKDKKGRSYVAGLARIMHGPTSWPEGFCHVDEMPPLSKKSGAFSANIYLQQPFTGGNLEIFNVDVQSRWDFYVHASTLSYLTVQDQQGQQRLRKKFPEPITIKPDVGDLVLLCVQRPHAVQGFPIGSRVSMQSFISYEEGKPLHLDN